jgi:hypothetical protein
MFFDTTGVDAIGIAIEICDSPCTSVYIPAISMLPKLNRSKGLRKHGAATCRHHAAAPGGLFRRSHQLIRFKFRR